MTFLVSTQYLVTTRDFPHFGRILFSLSVVGQETKGNLPIGHGNVGKKTYIPVLLYPK